MPPEPTPRLAQNWRARSAMCDVEVRFVVETLQAGEWSEIQMKKGGLGNDVKGLGNDVKGISTWSF